MAALPPPPFLSPLRRLVQGGFVLYCLWIGLRFYRFFQWAAAHGGDYSPRPSAVEAFLPIGALVSLKQLLLTRQYDPIHPAGLTIFMAALLLGFCFRKGFCGWICPVGFLSELLSSTSRGLMAAVRPSARPLPFRLPHWLDLPLSLLKYLLLAFFLYLIFWQMDLAALEDFRRSAYNLTVDGRMLLFFLHPSRLTLMVLIALAVLSLLFRSFWCRHLCPYGALLGLLALAGPLQISRDPEKCIDCKKCEAKCPAAITITTKSRLTAPECIGCLECVAGCPRKLCLTLTVYGRKPLTPLALPLGLLTLFFTLWLAAVLTGHWQSSVPDEILRPFYLQLP